MDEKFPTPENKFRSPQEEISALSERVGERIISSGEKPTAFPAALSEELKSYGQTAPEEILHPEYQTPAREVEKIVLNLAPETHDGKMAELVGILQEKGLRNALSVVEKLKNPHIEDDFHRFLAEYLREGFAVPGLKEKSDMGKALGLSLYKISMPDGGAAEGKSFKELVSSMEQFYAGMLSVDSKEEAGYFTLEVALPAGSDEISIYAAVPLGKADLFEKHLIAIFPRAKLKEQKDDYNIFYESGESAGAFAASAGNPVFPLKTYAEFDYDPLNVLFNAFSKLDKEKEGAAMQLVFSPDRADYVLGKYKKALKEIEGGKPLKEAINVPLGGFSSFLKEFGDIFSAPKKKEEGKETPPPPGAALEQIRTKVGSRFALVNLRLASSSPSKERSEKIISEISSAFNQFGNASGNSLKFEILSGWRLGSFLRDFSYRIWNDAILLPLNLKEVTTLFHLPSSGFHSGGQMASAKALTAPAPLNMPASGILLGINKHRNEEKEVYMSEDDRMRHLYVIGQTGTGKTTLLKQMIIQDMKAGRGLCFIDPHGSDVEDVLGLVPEERKEDVIYFNPGDVARPVALNMLEYDARFPEQKTFVVNELLSIFNKLFNMDVAGGPMFEQYFRNSVLLVLEDIASGSTLFEVARVLSDKAFRDGKLGKTKNPMLTQFWREIAEKAGGDTDLKNMVPYIVNKFDIFLSNDIMRPIIGQERSSLRFREIMDEKKILLVNLSKGRLGDINSNLIGLILVGKILMAALSRADSLGRELPPFYLYIDEFQNITTDSIATIFSEARKYKLSLTVAHQFIAQLPEKTKGAVFGNVGSICSFRVGADDAEYLAKQFEPVFSSGDIMNLDNRNAYLKLLVSGRPERPFNIETLPAPKGDRNKAASLSELSHLKYGREREEVEREIAAKYQSL